MSHASDPARSDRPSLEQKRKLAKELLKAVKRLDASQAARFTWNHPRFRGKSASDVIREAVVLADAQHVIASESGFASWPKLTEYVRLLDAEPNGRVAAFEDAVRAIIRGQETELRNLLNSHPEIVSMRSTRRHRCVLPHYLAANGVEDEHQVVPENAAEIADILFQAGADSVVDATTEIYGGGGGSTPLVALVTSSHPHEQGVQAELVERFCQAGARVNGLDDDCMPLAMALGFRYPAAARALVNCGARIDNLPAAAAVGDSELLQDYLDPKKEIVSERCTFPNPGQEEFPQSVAPHPARSMQQALVFACMCGRRENAKLLLEMGVDVNGGPRRGITAMHEACYQGEVSCAELLLSHGADPTIRDQMWNSTAIGWSDGGKQAKVIDWLFQQQAVDILDAVELKRYDIVRRELRTDASLANAPDGQGGALRFSAFKGDIKMVRLLLEYGALPNLENENGHTALDYAEKNRHRDVANLLREAIKSAQS